MCGLQVWEEVDQKRLSNRPEPSNMVPNLRIAKYRHLQYPGARR